MALFATGARHRADGYARQSGAGLGDRFLTQVARTLGLIARHSASGSTRHVEFVPDLPAPLRFLHIAQLQRYLIY